MPNALTVHLNEDRPQSIEVPQAYEATGDFDVFLENHGEPIHAHVRLDPTLSNVATVRTPNRYVDAGATRKIHVDVEDGDRPIEGRLEVVTGYGANNGYVSVTIREPREVRDSVAVDESLSEPRRVPRSTGPSPERIILFAVAAIAILLAVGTALITRNILVTGLVAVVLLAVGTAGTLLLS